MKLSFDKIIALVKWAESKKVVPLTVETESEAKIFTQIDKCLGINHQWKVGDKYYKLMCPIPKS